MLTMGQGLSSLPVEQREGTRDNLPVATKTSAEQWRGDRDNFLLDLGAFAELRAVGRDTFLLTIKEPAEALGRDWDNLPAPLRLLTDSWATDTLSGGGTRA